MADSTKSIPELLTAPVLDTGELQDALGTNRDGFFGEDTKKAVIEFLKQGDNFHLIPKLNTQIDEYLRFDEDVRDDFLILQRRAEGLSGLLRMDIGRDYPEKAADIEEFQRLLNENGHDAGTPDGDWGNQTAAATARHIETNPESLGYIDTSILGDLLERGHQGQLSEAASSSNAYVERLKVLTGPLDVPSDAVPHYLRQEQILLKIGGYYDGPINGEHSEALSDAVRKFEQEHSNSDKAPGTQPSGVNSQFARSAANGGATTSVIMSDNTPRPDEPGLG